MSRMIRIAALALLLAGAALTNSCSGGANTGGGSSASNWDSMIWNEGAWK